MTRSWVFTLNSPRPRCLRVRVLGIMVLLWAIALPWPALSAIEFLGASGYSAIDTTGPNPVIYAGTAGADTVCTSQLDGTCNNCPTTAGTFTACNPKRVVGGTTLTLNFKSTTATGCPTITGAVTTDSLFSSSTSVAAGATASIAFTWGELCPKLQVTAANCAENIKKTTIRVGISDACADELLDGAKDDSMVISIIVQKTMPDDTTCSQDGQVDTHCAIYEFKATPGDQKAYFLDQDIVAGSSFPNSASGIKYTKILVFHHQGTENFDANGFSQINVNGLSDSFAELNINEDSQKFYLAPDFVSGLTNEKYHYFRFAAQDVAGNVGYFTTDLQEQDIHAVRPGQVVGVLDEDMNCFIATATYGSPFADQVQTFRDFRDRYLKTSVWGRKFIKQYYEHSPKAAQWISRSRVLRWLSRGLLLPFALFAQLSLASSFSIALLISISGLLVAAWLVRRSANSARSSYLKENGPRAHGD